MAYLKNGAMRIQSAHSMQVRGLDAYFSPMEAVWPLIDLEPRMPRTIWEPAAGNGQIVKPLMRSGFRVVASDIADYGATGFDVQTGVNYLEAVLPKGVGGIVTNPPYRDASEFVMKAISEVPYSAWLLRTNFLESTRRFKFFQKNPPARVLVSSRRLPMMHRVGYDGPKSTSNTCYAWFVWDSRVAKSEAGKIKWFDWKNHLPECEREYDY